MGRRTYVAMFNDGVATFLATEWGSEGLQLVLGGGNGAIRVGLQRVL